MQRPATSETSRARRDAHIYHKIIPALKEEHSKSPSKWQRATENVVRSVCIRKYAFTRVCVQIYIYIYIRRRSQDRPQFRYRTTGHELYHRWHTEPLQKGNMSRISSTLYRQLRNRFASYSFAFSFPFLSQRGIPGEFSFLVAALFSRDFSQRDNSIG